MRVKIIQLNWSRIFTSLGVFIISAIWILFSFIYPCGIFEPFMAGVSFISGVVILFIDPIKKEFYVEARQYER